MTSRAMENEMMVAALLGISPEEASQLLDKTAYVSGGGAGSAGQLAEAVRANLGRTIHLAEAGSSCDIEVVLGEACVTNAAHKIYVDMRGRALSLSYEDREGREVEEVHPLKVEIAACYIASSVLSTILDVPDAPQGDLEVVFEKLGLFDDMLCLPVCLEDAVLLGGGAVGNGFLRGLRHIDVRGRLTVIDPKNVRNGNLNRCLYFSELDEELPKALQLALRAQAGFDGLVLEPFVGDFAAYMRSAKRVKRGNYFYMSPWSPPNVRARKFRRPDGECRFCSDPAMVDGIKALWSDVLEERGGR